MYFLCERETLQDFTRYFIFDFSRYGFDIVTSNIKKEPPQNPDNVPKLHPTAWVKSNAHLWSQHGVTVSCWKSFLSPQLFSPTAECYGVFSQYRFRCVLGRFREGTWFREPVPGSVSGTVSRKPGSGPEVSKVSVFDGFRGVRFCSRGLDGTGSGHRVPGTRVPGQGSESYSVLRKYTLVLWKCTCTLKVYWCTLKVFFVLWKYTYVLRKYFLYFESILIYFESIPLYFESIVLYVESILLYIEQVCFCTLKVCHCTLKVCFCTLKM